MAFDREQMKKTAAELAAKGVYVGTSSWKYQGWFGQLYTPARYEYRGKVAKTRFERDCLREYPERYAMQALGHNSKGVHRAYAKKAQVTLPSLEEYERAHANAQKIR